MRYFLAAFALMLMPAVDAARAQDSAFPEASAFEAGSGRLWFSGCTFEADRYISCKSAAPGVLEAISNPGDQPAGVALQLFIGDTFIEKGCAFEAPSETFRVNGIFLSFDTKAAKDIRCKGQTSAVAFAPEGMTFLDTLYFFSGDAPQ